MIEWKTLSVGIGRGILEEDVVRERAGNVCNKEINQSQSSLFHPLPITQYSITCCYQQINNENGWGYSLAPSDFHFRIRNQYSAMARKRSNTTPWAHASHSPIRHWRKPEVLDEKKSRPFANLANSNNGRSENIISLKVLFIH